MTEEIDALEEAFAGLDFERVRAAVPEEYKSVLEPIKTPKALIDSFVNAQKLIGKKNENAIPGEKATPEDWESFYRKIGKPEKADDYIFETELPEEKAKALKEIFANNNLTKKQAADVVKKMSELENNYGKAEAEKFEAFKQEQEKERKLKYGENLEKNSNLVNHAIGKLAGENKDFAESLKLLSGDNQYFEMFKKIGEIFDSANPNAPVDKGSGNKTQTPRERIDEILDPSSQTGRIYGGLERSTPEKRAAIEAELKELYKQLATKQ